MVEIIWFPLRKKKMKRKKKSYGQTEWNLVFQPRLLQLLLCAVPPARAPKTPLSPWPGPILHPVSCLLSQDTQAGAFSAANWGPDWTGGQTSQQVNHVHCHRVGKDSYQGNKPRE